MICTITHELGHSESTSLTANPDISGSKNAIQAIGSTISYLERYTVLALTGLATKDMDDDGVSSAQQEFILPEQAKLLTDIIFSRSIDSVKFLEWMKVETIDTILAKDFKKAKIALSKAKGQPKKPQERQPGEDG